MLDYKLWHAGVDLELSCAALRGGRLCGYLLGRRRRTYFTAHAAFAVIEAVHRAGELGAYGAMLPALHGNAALADYQAIHFHLPAEHPLRVWADRRRAHINYHPPHDMALITDLERFLRAMGSELSRRFADSRWHGARTSLQ